MLYPGLERQEAIELLLAKGADINSTARIFGSPLRLALENERLNFELACWLLNKGANVPKDFLFQCIPTKDEGGSEQDECQQKSIRIIIATKYKLNINKIHKDGSTALSRAAGDAECLKTLG